MIAVSGAGPLGVSRYLVVLRSVRRDDRVGALTLLVCLSALGPGIFSPVIFSLVTDQSCLHKHNLKGKSAAGRQNPKFIDWLKKNLQSIIISSGFFAAVRALALRAPAFFRLINTPIAASLLSFKL
jgi:hypothetical protein